jgi:hypothetical protein
MTTRTLRRIGILVVWIIAAVIFWLIYFKAAPAIVNLFPLKDLGEWKALTVFAIYVCITLLGGAWFPIFIGIGGTTLIKAALDD